MKHKAIILRVNRNAAGARFPFDRVYFFKKEAQEHLSRIFQCALVIDPTKTFAEMLKTIVNAYSCKSGAVNTLKRRDEDAAKKEIDANNPILHIIENYKRYVGLVPILYLQHGTESLI